MWKNNTTKPTQVPGGQCIIVEKTQVICHKKSFFSPFGVDYGSMVAPYINFIVINLLKKDKTPVFWTVIPIS
jgi:hypothetical protein